MSNCYCTGFGTCYPCQERASKKRALQDELENLRLEEEISRSRTQRVVFIREQPSFFREETIIRHERPLLSSSALDVLAVSAMAGLGLQAAGFAGRKIGELFTTREPVRQPSHTVRRLPKGKRK